MDKLRAAGLYMSSLYPLKGKMVERYNQCLLSLGLEPTGLSSINIDAIGWSPEVAEEKEEIHYLNHGGANPYGIIMSPEQNGLPIYFPFHSFDRDLVDLFFKENLEAIKDITADAAIIINLDQDIDAFYEPSDLVDYSMVTVGYKILGELDREQIKQNTLVQKMYRGHNSLDVTLHHKILASATKHGDLRGRSLQLREIDYQTTSFYTKAFGGVFVLRSKTEGHLLIFESMEEINKYQHTYMAEHIASPNLLNELVSRGYIHFDATKIGRERIERITQYYFAESVDGAEHSLSDVLTNKSLYLKYLNQLSQEAKMQVIGPIKFLEKIASGHNPERTRYMTDDIFRALHSPVHDANSSLMWMLICRMQPTDPFYTYYFDKELFYAQFANYSEGYKEWVIKLITEELKTKSEADVTSTSFEQVVNENHFPPNN
jgi:hypothetical protein